MIQQPGRFVSHAPTLEAIRLNPDFIDMVKELMAQNAVILHMNQRLIEILAQPPMYKMPDLAQETPL